MIVQMVSDDSDQEKSANAGRTPPESPAKSKWVKEESNPQPETKAKKEEHNAMSDESKTSGDSKEQETVHMISDNSDLTKLFEAALLAPELPAQPKWMNDVSSPQLELIISKDEPNVISDQAKISKDSKEQDLQMISLKEVEENE